MPQDDAASFDHIFDPNIKPEDEDVSMLAMQIAMLIRDYLNKNSAKTELLLSKKSNEEEKDKIKSEIIESVQSYFGEYLKDLGNTLKTNDDSGSAKGNHELVSAVINKTIEESLKIIQDVGSQEGPRGIGWWSVGKTIKSSLTYYGNRIRGNSKLDSLLKQLDNWQKDYDVEYKVRNAISKEEVYDKNALDNRLSHWDRRILLKTQKIAEKTAAVAEEKILDFEKKRRDLNNEFKN